MAYRLIYTKPAVRDLEEIVRYIAQDSPRAAEQVGVALIELAESLVPFPYRGSALRHRPGVRKVVQAPTSSSIAWTSLTNKSASNVSGTPSAPRTRFAPTKSPA